MDTGILEKTGIFRLGVDHLRPRVHVLLRISAEFVAGQQLARRRGKEPGGNRLKPAAAITAGGLGLSSSHSAKEHRLDSRRRESSTSQLLTAKSKSRIRKAMS